MLLRLVTFLAPLLLATRAAEPRPTPRADPYEHPADAAREDFEQREAKCRHLKSCDRCTLADGCVWCVDELLSGDGSTTETIAACVAGNQTFPGAVPDNRKCNAGYHHLICPCPNQCSGHGTCQSKGDCMCFRAFEGEDCSKKRDSKMNPAVVIPICIAIVGIAVGAIVVIHLKQSRHARSDVTKSGKDKDSDVDTAETISDADYASAEGPDIQLLAQRAPGFDKLRVQ
jgi:hypothetical protein